MSQLTSNSFQVPNAFVDQVLCQISDVGAKLYLIICRKTRGWFKEEDSISLSQFQKLSGKSRPTIVKALDELIQVGLVIECKSTIHGNSFKLNDECVVGWMVSFPSKESLLPKTASKKSLLGKKAGAASKKSLPLLVKNFNYTSKEFLPLLVKILYTQKTLSKDTIQNKKINKKSKSVPEQPKAEKPKAEKQNSYDAKSIELPVSVNRDLWIQFVDMRNGSKKPLTENAVKLILKKLESYGAQANESLEYSIIGNYQGVFPPKQPVQQQQYQGEYKQSAEPSYFAQAFDQCSKSNVIDVTPECAVTEGLIHA